MLRCNVLSLVFSSLPLLGQTAQNPLANSELKDPDGQRVEFKFQTQPNKKDAVHWL